MKTIKLYNNGTGRYDDVSPFNVTDNQLRLTVELPPFNGEFYLVAENNGKIHKSLIPREGEISLENLSAGELNAEVKHYLKGALIKVYKVEPLFLKEVDGTLSAMPEIATLNLKIAELEQEIAELKQAFGEYKKTVAESFESANNAINELEKKDGEFLETQNKLISFAYEDFKDNVYLGGGTAEEFAEKFGFDNETIILLKGEKNDDED